MRSLSLTIRAARTQLGLSQSEVASRAGIGLATVQNIEGNRGNPEFNTLLELFKVLHIKMILQSETPQLDWRVLANLGCPLTVDRASQEAPSRFSLVKELSHIEPQNLKGRERKAIASLLEALRDHYPSIWPQLPSSVRAWSQNQPSNPKLRRMALARLGEYL